MILSVGMGAPDVGFKQFGEETDLRARAELVDEGLLILNALWSGQPLVHRGKHYQVDMHRLRLPIPRPIQQPRIPIWAVGAWPRPKSMHRVARCDGLLPYVKPRNGKGRAATPEDIVAMKAWIGTHRALTTPFDIVIEGETPGDDPQKARDIAAGWEAAGATWFIESRWGGSAQREARLRQGPPCM